MFLPMNRGLRILLRRYSLADIDGDGRIDYVVVDDKTGLAHLWLNGGVSYVAINNWLWTPQGPIVSDGSGGATIGFADMDGCFSPVQYECGMI